MDKYSPPPWSVEFGWADWNMYCEHTIRDDDGKVVAIVPSFQPNPIGERPEKRQEARRHKYDADLLGQSLALLEVVEEFVDRMNRFGEWDDGCFYYNKTSASELQSPIEKARKILDHFKETK